MDIENVLEKHGYKIGRVLGKGGFGICYLVYSVKYKMYFACKVISLSDNSKKSEIMETYKAEINALSKIDSKYIVKIYGFFEEINKLFIILEYCENGSISDLIDRNEIISRENLIRYTKQIAAALKSCHSINLAHLDIKPENILLTSNNRIKIADFGLSKFIENGIKIKRFTGSLYYEAPEIIKMKEYDPFKADVWSFGITVYIMAMGSFPFDTLCLKSIKSQLSMGIEMPRQYFPDDIKNIIFRCLRYHPENRPSFNEICSMFTQDVNNANKHVIISNDVKGKVLVQKQNVHHCARSVLMRKSISSIRIVSHSPVPSLKKLSDLSKTTSLLLPPLFPINKK